MTTINVLIATGEGGVEASKIPDTERYRGLCYDIYKSIIDSEEFKQFLENNNYTLKETFQDIKNYDNIVTHVEEGTYDIVIGPFQYSSDRMNRVDFTHIYSLSKDGILFLKDRKHWFKTLLVNIKNITMNVLLNPIIVLILVSVVFAFIFHFIQPTKKEFYNSKSIKSNIVRSVFSIMAILLGSKGILTSNHNLPMIGLVFVFFLVIGAMIFNYYLQAAVFEKLKLINQNDIFAVDNLKNITLLCPKGYVVGENIKRLGVKIINKEMTMTELVNFYINNPNDNDVKKANGIAIDYIDGLTRVEEHVNSDLHMSYLNYGFKELTFIIRKNAGKDKDILQAFNKQIEKQIYNFKIRDICKSYFSDSESNLCVM